MSFVRPSTSALVRDCSTRPHGHCHAHPTVHAAEPVSATRLQLHSLSMWTLWTLGGAEAAALVFVQMVEVSVLVVCTAVCAVSAGWGCTADRAGVCYAPCDTRGPFPASIDLKTLAHTQTANLIDLPPFELGSC